MVVTMAADGEGRKRAKQPKESKQEAKQPGLEEHFAMLEQTIERLASEDISLEEAFAAYSEGMEILKTCNEQIDRVEKQVMKLTQEGGLEALT